MRNQVGSPVARYVELTPLGDGAEGGAFSARDRLSGARVVVKRVPAERLDTARRSVAILRQVGSPHLPGLRELAPDPDGGAWLVTDWVDGVSLEPGPAAWADALADALALAHALAAIHRAGSHHGDVSLANAVRSPTGGVLLVDLAGLGRSGVGTPGFVAPEVLAGAGGAAADRFSLGAVLFARRFGVAPWPRPESLLAVQGRADVRARIAAAARPDESPPRLLELLVGLLDPDPTTRWSDDEAIIGRLVELHAAARAGRSAMPAPIRWWLPARWPYRGVDPAPTVAAIAGATGPRLVAIAGPGGSGRGRFVEDVVLRLQSEASNVTAVLADPDRLAAAIDRTGGWFEAWLDAPPRWVLGLREPPPPPVPLPKEAARALVAAAELARACVILPVDEALGRALADQASPQVRVVVTRAWSRPEIEAALRDAGEGDRAAWVDALARITGGWSGRAVRTIGAWARAELVDPEAADAPEILADADADPEIDRETARAVMRAHWSSASPTGVGLPAHLHDGRRPHEAVVASARARLEGELVDLARAQLAEDTGAPLRLAVDADDPTAIAAALATTPADADLRAWLGWMTNNADRLSARERELAARAQLAAGAPEAALAVLGEIAGPSAAIERGRALQRLGRFTEALGVLAEIADTTTALAWQARGLRIRILIDLGDLARAQAEGQREPPGDGGVSIATYRLWRSFAAMATGGAAGAEADLARAIADVAALDDRDAHGVRARAIQLLGNLAHDAGDLETALRRWADAIDAFAAAGEPIGQMLVRGSLAAVAVVGFDRVRGLAAARAVVSGMLARGQTDALVTGALALTQLQVRSGAMAEARAVAQLCDAALANLQVPPATAARRARIEAELAHAPRELPGLDRAAWLVRRAGFDRAGRALGATGLGRESAEAHVRAAGCARMAARLDLAAADIAAASANREADPIPIACERVEVAVAAGVGPAIERALIDLDAAVPCRRGDLDTAWARARAGWSAVRRLHPAAHPLRIHAASQLEAIAEEIMNKTPPQERSSVRAALWSDGDRDSLREWIDELGGENPRPTPSPPARAGRGSVPAPAADRTPELLRIYRRLAREDRLEPLLAQVVDAVMELTDAERGAMVVMAADGSRREVTRELDGQQGSQLSRSIIDRVLAEGEPVLSVDAIADERFDGSRSISHLNLRSVLAVPLRFRGETLGAVYVDHRLRRGNFDEQDLAEVERFAELAALAVAHARALADVHRQREELAAQHAKLAELLAAREAEVVDLRARVAADGHGPEGMIGTTTAMQKVFRLVQRLGDADVPVVIFGESGTGKELVARAIHDAGARRHGAFVAENCGAIPETLLESVLFGHARGAFTGADKAKPGLFEAASGGTIFLDEVAEMSAGMQTKLLRVLQEGEVRRVGENASRAVDVRVIAASNRDLDQLVERGQFRRDLYYRINVVRVELPPLRERDGDIAALLRFFLTRHGGEGLAITAAAIRALQAYRWPGNVRELENEVQRWVALCERTVDVADLSPAIRGVEVGPAPDDLRIRPRVDRLERDLIARALERSNNNQTRAAELLGLSRFGLQKKLRKLETGTDDE